MRINAMAVLFDSDGVLVDSHRHVERAWTRLAAEYELDINQLLSELAGLRAIDTLRRCLPSDRVGDAVARLEQLEVEAAPDVSALPGALEATTCLPDDRWTIVTSASRRLAEARWVGAGLPIPERTVTADDVQEGKPHPEPFQLAARQLGMDPADCLVFEDSPSGGRSARAAGAQVVAVGSAPWDSSPVARVADLAHVRFIVDEGGVTVEL